MCSKSFREIAVESRTGSEEGFGGGGSPLSYSGIAGGMELVSPAAKWLAPELAVANL